MILYTHSNSPRLQYIVGFIGSVLKAAPFAITSSIEEFKSYNGARINYSDSKITDTEIWIKPHTLLFEKDVKAQIIECFDTNGHKAFFKTRCDLSFDILAASFYLLSRYEEYLPYTKDMYGRYAFENSLAYKEGFLSVPLVNIWLQHLRQAIKNKFPAFITFHSSFTFLSTYDIDIAWSYRHKGWWRNAGGLLRSLLSGQLSLVKERMQVLRNKQKDPFDSFGWLHKLHERYKLKPYYFFLVPEKRGRYDKNIDPSCKAMQDLIRDHIIRYPIGIHPSWKSGDDVSSLTKEIAFLSKINGSPVVSSRQHYIRFNLPDGYRRLIGNGIQFDFSMGYGSINGFRASVASPFYWYDLEKEQQTTLMLFPFCYMEANSFYEQKFTPQQALEEMRSYYTTVKSVNGYFIMIWHNSFLGTDKLYSGWRDVYEHFVKEVSVL